MMQRISTASLIPGPAGAPNGRGGYAERLPRAGFIRTLLGGREGTLANALATAATSPHTSEVLENRARGLRYFRLDRALPDAEGSYQLLQIGSSILAVIEDLRQVGPRYELAPGENLLCLHVRLAGEFVTSIGMPDPVRFQGPHLGVRFQPQGAAFPLWFAPVPVARSVTIFCEPNAVLANLYDGRLAVPAALEQLLCARAPDVGYGRLLLSAELIACASSLLDAPLAGPLRLPYAEGKVLELLTLCLAAFARVEEGAVQQFSEADIRRFYKAREILAERFNPPPTISSIARELGINETKLKTGFKALFGHTIFEYGHEQRMQHALHLLRDRRLRIGLVAEAIGYTHQGTFASAFKAHFGVRPKDIRRPPEPQAMTQSSLATAAQAPDDDDDPASEVD